MIASVSEERPVAKKSGHGGKRPGAGRPPGNRNETTVKMDRALARMIRLIVESKGITMSEYLSSITRDRIAKDYEKLLLDVKDWKQEG